MTYSLRFAATPTCIVFSFSRYLQSSKKKLKITVSCWVWGANEVYDGTMLSWRIVFSSKMSSCRLLFMHWVLIFRGFKSIVCLSLKNCRVSRCRHEAPFVLRAWSYSAGSGLEKGWFAHQLLQDHVIQKSSAATRICLLHSHFSHGKLLMLKDEDLVG